MVHFFLVRKGWPHWAIAALILTISVAATPYVDTYLNFIRVRYWLFQQIAELTARAIEPRFVTFVAIGDEEFYQGYLARRTPLRRDYLARIVDALDAADASVIALDINMRLECKKATGAPSRYDELEPYRLETDVLMRAIARAADSRHVVLSATILDGRERDTYRQCPDVYQVYGICSGRDQSGRWLNPGTPDFPLTLRARSNISCGYIALPKDMRLLPPRIKMDVGPDLESFSFAIAYAHKPRIARKVGNNSYYSTYIPTRTIAESNVAFSASALLRQEPEVLEAVRDYAVIVGGQWHENGVGLGKLVDMHETPLGPIVGAVIHQNFVEGILDGRLYAHVPKWVLTVLEVLFGILAALVFAAYPSFWTKLIGFLTFSLVLVSIQWLMLQLFGTFFEAFVPLLGLWLHSILERFL